ncbi:MAG: hypothetical protein C0601_04785 [Candidatus Muiribacterium halophilum]|uniref:Transcription factor zinc-finger domain-containing protein n=1 Tax=Muiribacterium halophilum TaxID=2053465 RepID=A0A2N5ZI18_MUIH1|nr:MAG: hypothetical protein C0601_04785 [Candidatus Muirbacterium halophilum]
MKCPACDRDLTEKDVNGVKVDVCENGCAGIWFDNYELKKFDEIHENCDGLINIKKDPSVKVSDDKRDCPRCEDIKMLKHYFSIKRQVKVDECPACGGVFLDGGELEAIRSQFDTEKEREEAADKYFNSEFSGTLGVRAEEKKEEEKENKEKDGENDSRLRNLFNSILKI